MSFEPLLIILFRYIHIITACIATGGLFFMRVILPVGIAQLDEDRRKEVFLRFRRFFKPVIHTSILLFLVSGLYNAVRLWPQYNLSPGLTHGLFGLHVLLALLVFAIALVMLAGAEPPKSHRRWMMTNLVLLLVLIGVASALKWVRERAVEKSQPGPTPLVER